MVRRVPIRLCRVVTVPMTFKTLLYDQLKYLAEHGVELTLVSSPDSVLDDIGRSLNVTCCPVVMSREPDILRDARSLVALIRLFATRRFDIVHSVTPKAGLVTAIAGAVTGIPIRIHTYTGQVWAEMRGIPRRILKGCDWLIAHLNTLCFTDSESQRQHLVQEGIIPESGIAVLGAGSIAGVDLKRFNPDLWRGAPGTATRRELAISDQALVIVFVGRVQRDKGIAELVAAFSALRARDMNVELVVVGPLELDRAPVPGEVQSELAGNPHIHLVGFSLLPEKYLGIADVLCLPSYREGFGSVVIEAAAMGVPAVACRVTGLVDAVRDGETGLLVPARDPVSLADALQELLSSVEMRERMGRAAQERAVREFDAQIAHQRLLESYQKAMLDRRHGRS